MGSPVTRTTAAAFVERQVTIEGARIRCLEAGRGAPLIVLPGADGLRLGRAHDLLAERFRVIGLEVPGHDLIRDSAAASAELAESVAPAIAAVGVDRYSVMATSVSSALALRLAVQHGDRLDAVVLESPAALDPELGKALRALQVPTLVLFGTRDRVMPADTGRLYRERLGNGHLMLVYDASHAIAADRPEAFASLVGDFLERRDQFVVNRSSSLTHP